jgi:beta-glucanase (GH16 family)
MKKNILIGIVLFVLASKGFSQGYYKLDWYDEFSGTALSPAKWDYQLGTGENGNWAWGNDEKEYYTQENATVSDGMLSITAKREARGGMPFTSSRILTRNGRYSTTYGRIEARISLPAVQGMWPAFWMMPENSEYGGWARSGEIDIMEAKGRLPGQYGGAIHFGGAWPQNSYLTSGDYHFPGGSTIADFHVYAVEWEEGSIAWFCDGALVGKRTSGWYSSSAPFPAPFDKDFHILLNLAVGGNFDGGKMPPDDFMSGVMKVDYVRVYKWSDTLTEPEIPDDAGPVDPPIVDNNNLALNKTTTASSAFNHGEYGLLAASNATDGSYGTRWGSDEANIEYEDQWLKVDLEKVEILNKIVIEWEAAYAKSYDVVVSVDNVQWETVYTTTNGHEGNTEIVLADVPARYIQVDCKQKISPWQGNFYGYSIFELEAYGPNTTGVGSVKPNDLEVIQNKDAFLIRSTSNKLVSELYSINGQLVAKTNNPLIPVNQLNKGVYILKIRNDAGSQKTLKVIIN